MKKVVKLTALSLALAFTSSLAMAEENIAFVNAEYLFQNHPDRKAVADKLESEFKPTADKLAENKKQIDAKNCRCTEKSRSESCRFTKRSAKIAFCRY